jgi:hypothetical protein
MRKKLKWFLLVSCLLISIAAMTACGAPPDYRGKYNNTRVSDSYIDVTGEYSCNVRNVYINEFGLDGYYTQNNLRFDVSSDAKVVYVEFTSSISLRGSFNKDTKTITYAGYSYKK